MTRTERTIALSFRGLRYGHRPNVQQAGTALGSLALSKPDAELTNRQESSLWYISFTYRRQLQKTLPPDVFKHVLDNKGKVPASKPA